MLATKMILPALLLALAAPCSADEPTTPTTDAQAVEEASNQFYKSLNSMFTGDAAPMSEIWSHADDVTYMGPAGGIEVGWDQVNAQWEAQAALKLGGEVFPEDVTTTISGDMAIVQCREVGNNLDANGQPQTVSIRATNVFRKENGQWKMIAHHTDLLPFLNEDSSSEQTDD
jgi:ketosteroid isomerase-like protein